MIDLSRTPDHRWARVDQLITDGKHPSRSYDDKMIHKGYRFLKRYQQGSSSSYARLEANYPGLWSAFNMWTETVGPKWLIEAAILAGRTIKELAEYLKCSESQLTVYEKYFYDVREGIESKGWVVTRILLPAIARRLVDRDYDFLWKVIAYFGGWEALDAFIECRKLPAEVEIFLTDATRAKMIKDGFVATHVRSINSYTSNEIITQCLDLKRLELEQGQGGVQDKLSKSLESVFGALQISMIPHDKKFKPNEERVMELIVGSSVPLSGVLPAKAKKK